MDEERTTIDRWSQPDRNVRRILGRSLSTHLEDSDPGDEAIGESEGIRLREDPLLKRLSWQDTHRHLWPYFWHSHTP